MADKTVDKSTFEKLSNIDVAKKLKEKNKLTYLPWSSAWAEVKKIFPDATYKVYPQTTGFLGEGENIRFIERPWHDDGRSGWVEVGVTINGEEIIETLPIMDFKNKAIAADAITSTEVNKAIKRCLVKAIALHGLALYIYEGEDLPEEASDLIALQNNVMELVLKKCALSEEAKDKVAELCKAAEKKFDDTLDDESLTGNPKTIEDKEILEELKKKLLAIRK